MYSNFPSNFFTQFWLSLQNGIFHDLHALEISVNDLCLLRLGSAGLCLHYANIVLQIDTLVSFPLPFYLFHNMVKCQQYALSVSVNKNQIKE